MQDVSEKLRICVLAACPFPANHGTPGSIRELVEGLAARGHEVHLVTYPHGEDIAVDGVKLHRVSGWFKEEGVVVGPTWRKPIYDFLMVLKAIRICWSYRIDIMHAHLYEAAIAAWLTRILTFRRFVYSAHNTMADELGSYDFFKSKRFASGLARFLDWFVPARADRCIPHSLNIEKFLHGQGLQDHCAPVINFGIDVADVVSRRENLDAGQFQHLPKPLIVYTGILDNFQRLDLLLEAMKHVIAEAPDTQLAIGMTLEQPDFVENLRSMTRQLGIEQNVHFTARLSFDECLQLLEHADVAISPRPQTPGFPIKLLNYWAMEKPVVMFESSAGGISHRVEAWLAPHDTAESLAAGILTVARDPTLQKSLSREGSRFVAAEHDRGKVTEHLERVFYLTLGHSLPPQDDNNTPLSVERNSKVLQAST